LLFKLKKHQQHNLQPNTNGSEAKATCLLYSCAINAWFYLLWNEVMETSANWL